jgi:hypothetical protein
VDLSAATTPIPAPAQEQDVSPTQPAGAEASTPAGFRSRGSARRRARFLRKARELAYRDLGGLVYSLHRFGQRNDPLVLAKLTTIGKLDTELRTIEAALQERQPITVLREAGITACARCAAIHSSEDNFCPNCGLSMARHADLPAGFQSASPAPASPAPASPAPASPAPASPAPAPAAPASTPPPAPSASPPMPASPAPQADDGPTEILRPPTQGT